MQRNRRKKRNICLKTQLWKYISIFLKYSSMVYNQCITTWHSSWHLENMNNKHISCNKKENVLRCSNLLWLMKCHSLLHSHSSLFQVKSLTSIFLLQYLKFQLSMPTVTSTVFSGKSSSSTPKNNRYLVKYISESISFRSNFYLKLKKQHFQKC